MSYVNTLLKNYNIKSVLDIGANIGQFFDLLNNDFYVFCIEANKDCEEFLKLKTNSYAIACLSKEKGKQTFYKTKINSLSTGNSLYRENTRHYSDENLVCEVVDTITLDELLAEKQQDIKFDLIKLDTQGSELDILKGGLNTLKNAQFVLTETDVSGYNIGVPCQQDIIAFLNDNGFKLIGVTEQHFAEGKLVQQDLLFEKGNI